MKRLRIGGKFVTKQKAFEILGLTNKGLLTNQSIQDLLDKRDENKRYNSII